MVRTTLDNVDLVILTMARSIVENADYFSQLDAVAGDGDFGFSLRNGFEAILAEYHSLDRMSVGSLLREVGLVISSKVGGVSGPLWGTAFLRAGVAAGDRTDLTPAYAVEVLRAAAAGIMERGDASVGDKTLLDALVPAIDRLEQSLANGLGDGGVAAVQQAADAATKAAEDTLGMLALRGRAAYTGERSRASVDAGAMAIAVILRDISAAWKDAYSTE